MAEKETRGKSADGYFAMVYPCYLLMVSQPGAALVVGLVGDERCLCLFTDGDRAERFSKDLCGPVGAPPPAGVRCCRDRDDLLETLGRLGPEMAAAGVSRVAIDPTTPGSLVGTAPLREFVGWVEQQP